MLQDCVVCAPTIAAPAVPGGASAAGGGALVVSRDLEASLAETAASLAPLERLARALARSLSLEKLHGARRTASALEDVEALVGVPRGRHTVSPVYLTTRALLSLSHSRRCLLAALVSPANKCTTAANTISNA